jgi:hypothetical protein
MEDIYEQLDRMDEQLADWKAEMNEQLNRMNEQLAKTKAIMTTLDYSTIPWRSRLDYWESDLADWKEAVENELNLDEEIDPEFFKKIFRIYLRRKVIPFSWLCNFYKIYSKNYINNCVIIQRAFRKHSKNKVKIISSLLKNNDLYVLGIIKSYL